MYIGKENLYQKLRLRIIFIYEDCSFKKKILRVALICFKIEATDYFSKLLASKNIRLL